MNTAAFDYQLPIELIAQTPAEPRDSSKLMVLDRATGRIEHRIFRDIGEYLRPGDLMVLNNTRVIPARLYGRKAGTGGRVEILLLAQESAHNWQALVGGRRTRVGTVIELNRPDGAPAGVSVQVQELGPGGQRLLRFDRPSDEWLLELGNTPLPPYIRNYTGDPERYQTVYARPEGSAAAPTAGLHFTPELLLELRAQNIQLAYITLRIGLDTFKPIDKENILNHSIHTEWAQLGPETAQQINQTKLAGGRIVAVGTTAVRTLETAALQARSDPGGGNSCGWNTVAAFEGPTDLYITPGFSFQAVDVMLSNFHLPRSTLIVLVSTFAGLNTIKQAYQTAIKSGYRFYSFGDAMLIL